jgi:hypothetical protein
MFSTAGHWIHEPVAPSTIRIILNKWQTVHMSCFLGRDIALMKVHINYALKQGCTNPIHHVTQVTKSKFRTLTPVKFVTQI